MNDVKSTFASVNAAVEQVTVEEGRDRDLPPSEQRFLDPEPGGSQPADPADPVVCVPTSPRQVTIMLLESDQGDYELDLSVAAVGRTCGEIRRMLRREVTILFSQHGRALGTRVRAPEWFKKGQKPPDEEKWAHGLTPRAMVAAYCLIIGGRQPVQQTTLRTLENVPSEEQREADRMEDAERLVEAASAIWPPVERDTKRLSMVHNAMRTLEVRKLEDGRGRGLFASTRIKFDPKGDGGSKMGGQTLTPYFGVPAPAAKSHNERDKDEEYALDLPGFSRKCSFFRLDRTGQVTVDDLDLPLGQFCNEPLADTVEVHNAMFSRDGIKPLRTIEAGEQILLFYGAQYPRSWERPQCCWRHDHSYANRLVRAVERSGGQRSTKRTARYEYVLVEPEHTEAHGERNGVKTKKRKTGKKLTGRGRGRGRGRFVGRGMGRGQVQEATLGHEQTRESDQEQGREQNEEQSEKRVNYQQHSSTT